MADCVSVMTKNAVLKEATHGRRNMGRIAYSDHLGGAEQ